MDRAEFKNWLKEQSRETCVKIAARAAVRVFPIVFHINGPGDRQIQLALSTARAILTSGIASTIPTPKVRDAANAAANAVNAAYTANATIAVYAANVANAANAAAYAAYAAYAAKSANAAADAAYAAYTASTATDATNSAPANAANAAAYEDTKTETAKLFDTPIWHISKEPDWLVSALEPFPNLLESGPEWSFWHEWYQGFLIGKPLDWEMQKEIALIPDADWEKGPEWIAGLIAKIRERYDRKPLDQEQVKEQAKRLIAQPETTALVTNSVADQIDDAVEQYFAQAKVNKLPEALEPLHHLPPLLRRISKSSQADDKIADLQAEINELVATVNSLNIALAAKGNSLGNKVVETIVLTTVALGTAAFWGSVVAGISHVTGIVDVGGLIERLSSAAPQVPQLLDLPPAPRPPTC